MPNRAGMPMARIRSIKPEFWTSEQVTSCTHSTRLLFIGLWNFCDDSGHHPLAPKQIKGLVFPCDVDVTSELVLEMIQELSETGLVRVYEVAGRKYIEITGWHHQKIDKPQKPKFPLPLAEGSLNIPRMVATEGNTEYRRDGKGVESDQNKKGEGVARSLITGVADLKSKEALPGETDTATPTTHKNTHTPIDPNYRPPLHLIEECRRDGTTDEVIDFENKKFVAHHQSAGTFSVNWDASWTTWWSRWKDHPKVKPHVNVNVAKPFVPTEADWDKAIEAFKKNESLWPRWAGNTPGSGGCKCPPEVLLKHDFDSKLLRFVKGKEG
jgi:hypothetical protein